MDKAFFETSLKWSELIWLQLLKLGPIPQHVIVIIDGFRPLARDKQIPLLQSHQIIGYERLNKVLQCLRVLGVNQVTVYIFSMMGNLNQPPDQMDGVSKTVYQSLLLFYTKRDLMMKDGIGIRFVGNLTLLPKNLQNIMGKLISTTKANKKFVVNYAMHAYYGREEIYNAVKTLLNAVQLNLIQPKDINQNLLVRCFSAVAEHDYSEAQLIIRTSGEVRRSKFLLWQSSYAYLFFSKLKWSQFDTCNFIKCLIKYQKYSENLMKYKRYGNHYALGLNQSDNEKCKDNRVNQFYSYLMEKKSELVKTLVS